MAAGARARRRRYDARFSRAPARPPADRYEPFTHGRVRASEKIDLLPRVVAVALVRRDAG
jgi:hypothetical protein